MTNDEKLMAQALKALDWISRANAMDYEYRIKANEVLPALRERLAQSSEMDEAIAAGDGTLHGAIDYWQERALKAEARLAQKDEQAEPCVCGNSIKSNTEHRTDGPCYRKEPSAEPTRNEVISFLLGEAPLDGVWFDEPHPTYKGRFWWREYLLKATEPSAEPVAYRYRYIDGWRTNGGGPVNGVHPVECQPLYTAPQPRQWVGLTDEEIDQAVKSCNTTDTYKYFRAIEAKLKEKNG